MWQLLQCCCFIHYFKFHYRKRTLWISNNRYRTNHSDYNEKIEIGIIMTIIIMIILIIIIIIIVEIITIAIIIIINRNTSNNKVKYHFIISSPLQNWLIVYECTIQHKLIKLCEWKNNFTAVTSLRWWYSYYTWKQEDHQCPY